MAQSHGLPSGIVTFVFTDVEGSTRLLRRMGDRYADLIDRHLELMASAWAEKHGHLVDTAGDGVFVAFRDPTAAVEACAKAQRLLAAEPWPHDVELRVRMGLHTGLAVPHGLEYRALAVHQAARVMSAAHGGQTLLSEATVARLSRLGDVAILPLGRYRIRDFDDPVQLFELSGPGLPSGFPALRALPADGHNLVAPPTSFRGRDEETLDVAGHLGPGRLVTLTGPGGVGKTRLATEVGLQVVDDWPDGVWMVDLAPFEDPALIGPAIAGAVGAPSRGGDRWSELVDHLHERQALLVLDNCEQLAHECGVLVDQLLGACPACGVLATSRVPLGGAREERLNVQPLPVFHPGPNPLEEAARSPAVSLFLDRARQVRQDFRLDETAAATTIEICRRLDGIPLALELAAARVAVLSPEEVLCGLSDRFRLLRISTTALPERQRTLEALLEWSYRLLEDRERATLRRLAVLGSSFSIRAATAAVSGDDIDQYDVPEIVWSLVEKSLAVADLTANATRYRLLESVREFGRRLLDEHGETEGAAVRLARWYLDQVGPRSQHDRGWRSAVAVEIDNLRALIPLVAPAEPALAQELAVTISRYLDAVDAFGDGVLELGRLVDELVAPTPVRVSMLTSLADLHLRLDDAEGAKELVAEAEAVHDEVGSLPAWDDVAIERTKGELACRSGDYLTAMGTATAALARDLSPRGRARMSSQLGIAAAALGDHETAAAAFAQEHQIYRELGDYVFEAWALGNLAEVALRTDDPRTAARHQRACLALALEMGAPSMMAFSLIVAARLSAAAGRWETATTLHSHAESILDSTGLVLYQDDRVLSDRMLEDAHGHLGDASFGAALAAGRALDLPAAAALADRVLAEASSE